MNTNEFYMVFGAVLVVLVIIRYWFIRNDVTQYQRDTARIEELIAQSKQDGWNDDSLAELREIRMRDV